jgi:hypothetical protein
MKTYIKTLAILSVLALATSVQAQVIGSWLGSDSDGWIDWSGGQNPVLSYSKYSLVSGVVPGYSQSLQLQESGWNQSLSIKLENNSPDQAYFFADQLLSVTWSIPAGTGGGYEQLWGLYINGGGGYGFTLQPASEVSITGSGETSGTGSELDFWSGSPMQTQTVTWNYSGILAALEADGNGPSSGYIELIFTSNSGGGAPNTFYFDQVTLSQVPEPTSLALIGLGAASLFWLRRKNS